MIRYLGLGPPEDCSHCNSFGVLPLEDSKGRFYDCTMCNGTGIKGNPRLICIVALVNLFILLGFVAYILGFFGGN